LTIILARQGRLEEVRDNWQKILAGKPAGHDAWYGYVELCLFLGHTQEYRRTRTDLLARFGDTTDPIVAERTGRACLLLPAEGEELRQAAALADRAEAAGAKHSFYHYFQSAKGLAEYRRGRPEQAIPWLQEATAAHIDHRMIPRLVLAMAQYRCGRQPEARQTLAAALEEYDWSETRAGVVGDWIYHVLRREAEELIVPNLAAFLRGQYQPQENMERLELIRASYFRKRYVAAARLSTDVFAAEPKAADDLDAAHRYNAACFAALAGCGQGKDADQLDKKERARLRQQALDWLRADLKAYRQDMDKVADKDDPAIAQRMRHWLHDAGFAGVRGAAALGRLPEAERADWQRLWQEVEALRQRADQRSAPASTARP
jgi:serine/threonine-protein kinase